MTIKAAAAKAAMCEASVHKYLRTQKLPSELKAVPKPSGRRDAFAGVWSECVPFLEVNPKLEANALFDYILDKYPDQFKPSQLRTFQRRVKVWKAQQPKEVFFAQLYQPGDRAQSDFTCMNRLGITIQGERFPHVLYHFVLAYSNWESVMICESESFASLRAGFLNAVYELGGVPRIHQTDSMSCAVKNHRGNKSEVFTAPYTELMEFFGVELRRTQPGCPNENGKVEQPHYRLKRAVENALTLRGSRDFESLRAYKRFLTKMVTRLNACHQSELAQEQDALGTQRLDSCERLQVRVSRGSTILVKRNRYSVPSTLIGQRVDVRLYVDRIDVWHAQTLQEQMPRLYGDGRHSIHYLHVIRDLVRKPGAFAGYRYRADLFPSRIFRMAYDVLDATHPVRLDADKVYLKVLELVARQSESGVEAALTHVLSQKRPITLEAVQTFLNASDSPVSRCKAMTVSWQSRCDEDQNEQRTGA